MESCLDTAQLYVYFYSPGISDSVTIATRTPLMRQDPEYWCDRYPTRELSLELAVLCWSWVPTWFNSPFLNWYYLSFPTWSTHSFLLDLNQFFYSIWLVFNEYIFDLACIVQVSLQSGFMDSHIGQGVFKIIQHWSRGIFHDSENSNWFWQEYSRLFEKSEKTKKEKDW